MLGLLACANLDDLYAAIGDGSIYVNEFTEALDLVGISRSALNWVTVAVLGSNNSNRPGVLSYLAGLVYEAGANILRTVSTTTKEGSFSLRMVLGGLDEVSKHKLTSLFEQSRFPLDKVEIV